MDCSSGCSRSPVKRCDELWFEDGNLVLQAQHTQYRVHRSLMSTRSEFFRDMLTLPCTTEGTEAAPLFLPDVVGKHFTVFMKFVYSQWGEDLKFTTDEWLYVVRVAHRFQFTSALRVAMNKCADLDPDRKLYWSEELGLTEWTVPARRAAVLAFDLDGDSEIGSQAYRALWLKIYRVRETLAYARLSYMQRCIQIRDHRPVQPLCEHVAAALAIVISRTPRKELKSAFDKAIKEGTACKEGWGDDLKFTPDDWMCVVRVAHSLQFTSVLRVAMDMCEDEDADMKLLWAENLGITEWEVPARRAAVLAFDVTPATSPDYWPIWLKISRAREAVARARLAYIQHCIKLRAAGNNAQPVCQQSRSRVSPDGYAVLRFLTRGARLCGNPLARKTLRDSNVGPACVEHGRARASATSS
ncbi:hypothetical protein EXIGLDRAFT_768999 [Exidia glandulosa HHB12029]|uniref:BTB domain-containing protein n=1 Tax=Exidia glandulosa HHB12029 TaxID=1314781 RepID=A0A165HTR8_EXIGL|nr:hypothetical protein EXIGLDRAFT_768999 [Exidia glandulosa HHB12029]